MMSGKTEEVKGRIKEAVGALTGDDKLRDEGKADQLVGKVKQAAQKAAETVADATKSAVDAVAYLAEDLAEKAKVAARRS